MPQEINIPHTPEEKKERQSFKEAIKEAGLAFGALIQVAGELHGVSGMEELHQQASRLSSEVEMKLLRPLLQAK